MLNRPLPKEPMFTAAEAAVKLGISVKTLMRHVEDGRIRYVDVGTRVRKAYRFALDDIEGFVACQSTFDHPIDVPPLPTPFGNRGVLKFSDIPRPVRRR